MLRERRRHAHYKLNSRLDRKSSRGMIYENEELRLRTININAEVEKGQSDIKRLRRENEQLRREIWTLRDECDRLNKRFKTKLAAEYEKSDYSARGSSGNTSVSFWCDARENSGLRCSEDQGQSDDSDSCETCKIMENCQDENCVINECKQQTSNQCKKREVPEKSNEKSTTTINMSNLPSAFDHLSIVSEETLSNGGETHRPDAYHVLNKTSSSDLPPLTPTTPLAKFTNELIDSQAIIPPLSYFENIVHRESDTSAVYSTEAGCFPTRNYGWDQNIQSPFAVHKMVIATQQQSSLDNEIPKSPKLSTFKPKILPKPIIAKDGQIVKNNSNEIKPPPVIANLPPISLSPSTSSKPFFSTIRTCPPLSRPTANEQDTNFDPPDLTVTNGLATPYHRQSIPASQNSEELSQENLESLLNDIETISGDICALKMQKNQAREQLEFDQQLLIDGNCQLNEEAEYDKNKGVEPQLLQQYKDHKKAYRSEMNLLLSFNGTNTTFLPISKQKIDTQNPTDRKILHSTSLDKEYEQNSIPSMPDPMILFPDNHSYLPVHELGAYDQLKNSSALAREPIEVQPSKKPAFAPNKSQLFTCVQNLAAKRDLFHNAPSSVIRSLDISTNLKDSLTTNELTPEITLQQTADTLFLNPFPIDKTTEQNNTPSTGLTATAASWSDISAAGAAAGDIAASVDTKYQKSFSFSTPNSPNTLRRNSLRKSETRNDAIITEQVLNDEQQNPKPVSQDMSPQILSSIDIKKPQIIQKTCSRRHSECTVSSNNQRNGHCHMHRHHHHIHRPSLIKNNNNILLNNSRKDSNCETGASFSDRNSNSFSRESSISFNGNTRKISISSNKGGKIPWCGCWGNGCL